ncbi:hypothetical protein [Sphingobium yanoikuyae]|uniref:hypothetical protein n=1 Tax=Sphingobium yanoikuyae TaxID=13690 RepID=UPI0022DE7F40|nr:hypothetical protein [Sphingobium yanoikuyae]WBQ17641.1 hypothetical protein PAE53_05385 [Sphingobium yanoikuyae]
MSSDPKTDLIYAILALDSYNRGYGVGISGLANNGTGAKIGNFTISSHTDDRLDANLNSSFAAGFYALAYEGPGGETVIAYRGTDKNAPGVDPQTGGSDAFNGYGVALGFTETTQDSLLGTEQLRLALDFYRAVAPRCSRPDHSYRPFVGRSARRVRTRIQRGERHPFRQCAIWRCGAQPCR